MWTERDQRDGDSDKTAPIMINIKESKNASKQRKADSQDRASRGECQKYVLIAMSCLIS